MTFSYPKVLPVLIIYEVVPELLGQEAHLVFPPVYHNLLEKDIFFLVYIQSISLLFGHNSSFYIYTIRTIESFSLVAKNFNNFLKTQGYTYKK
jgi:hypothetical protein